MKNKHVLLFMLVTHFYSLGVGFCFAVDNPLSADVYLPFDEITDGKVMGGTYNGTFLEDSSATVESGIQGNGLNVSDTVMTIGNRRDSCFWLPDLCSEGFTLAVWIKILDDKAGDELYYISNGGQTGSSYGFSLSLEDRHLKAGVRTQGSLLSVTDTDITVLNEWIHVVITWNSHTNDTKLYINTVLKDSQNEIITRAPLTSSNYNEYIFGATNKNYDINFQAYYGEAILDELLFWEEVKSDDFIHYLYDYYMNECLDPFTVISKIQCTLACISDTKTTCSKFQYNSITSECSICYLDTVNAGPDQSTMCVTSIYEGNTWICNGD